MPTVLRCEVCDRCGRVHPRVPYLTVAQAAAYLSITPKALRSRRARGEMPKAHRLGTTLRFCACAIAALLQEEA